MPEILRTGGVVVGLQARTYNAFTDSNGREVAGGTTYRCWLADPDAPSAPVEVRVTAEQYDSLVRAGFAAPVAMECEAYVRNNRLDRRCVQVTHVGKAGPVPVPKVAS